MSTSLQLIIRPREPSDLPSLIPILQAVYKQVGYPIEGPFTTDADVLDFISPPNSYATWVAELRYATMDPSHIASANTTSSDASSNVSTRVIGQVAMNPFVRNAREYDWAAAGNTPKNSGHLGRLFVSPDAQGLGAGKALVRTVMDWARAEGKRLCIYVVTKDVAATRLYEKLGWRRIGMETYRGWDNWMYVWHPEWEERSQQQQE